MTAFRIDHCLFRKGERVIYADHTGGGGISYGVIDHCSFINPEIAFGIAGDGNTAWQRPVKFGTTNMVCVEDCYVYMDNNVNVGSGLETQQPIYTDHGAELMVRNSYFDASGITDLVNNQPCSFINNEGCNNGGGASDSGTHWFECYSNTFKSYNSYRMTQIRGGFNLLHHNTLINPGTPNGDNCATWCFFEYSASIFHTGSYPYKHQVTNSFVWGNTYNGTAYNTVSFWTAADAAAIQLNRDYWQAAPAANNGAPVGSMANYTPLVYPHPLVTAQDGSATISSLIAGPNPLDFGIVTPGSTHDLQITISNAGPGSVQGTASVAPPFYVIGASGYVLASNQAASKTVRYVVPASQVGRTNQTMTLTGSGGTSVQVRGATAFGDKFGAAVGDIGAPFHVNADGSISQDVDTVDPTLGGSAVYTFYIANAGYYEIGASVAAPGDSANSIFVNVDSEPTTPTMIWDMTVNSGFTIQTVRWRDSASPKVWMLTQGLHTLIIRGRESNAMLSQIIIGQAPNGPRNLAAQ
jgi:hypothetical protein